MGTNADILRYSQTHCDFGCELGCVILGSFVSSRAGEIAAVVLMSEQALPEGEATVDL